MRRIPRIVGSAVVTVSLLLAAGCSGGKRMPVVPVQNDTNIKRVASLYTQYQTRNGWAGPKTEAEFKEFIAKVLTPDTLRALNVDPNNVAAVFVSDRDGQPLRIKYGVGGGPGMNHAVVFEQAGRDGTKQVAFTFGKVEDATEARYKELWDAEPEAPSPPAGRITSGATGRPKPKG